MQHLTYVAKSIPFTFKDTHPFNGIITGWFKFEDAYIAVTDETIQFDYFYCPICNRWDKLEARILLHFTTCKELSYEGHPRSSHEEDKTYCFNC